MSDAKISEARNLLAEAFGCDPDELLDGEVRAVRAVLALQSVRPQPAELAEQQGVGITADWVLGYLTTDAPEDSREAIRNAFAEWAALAATGKQQVGDDGMPMVCVTQEFKDQADYDAEISSAASNLLRNNTLGLSGSLPEMVAALLNLASWQQVGEVQGIDLGQLPVVEWQQHTVGGWHAISKSRYDDYARRKKMGERVPEIRALIDQRDAAPGVGS